MAPKEAQPNSAAGSLMGTSKTEVDAKVVMEQNRLEFTTIDSERVEVSW